MKQRLMQGTDEINFSQDSYEFLVEFLHLSKSDSVQTVKYLRQSQEILFSTHYTQELQRNFKQEAKNYIRKVYLGAFNDDEDTYNSMSIYRNQLMLAVRHKQSMQHVQVTTLQ